MFQKCFRNTLMLSYFIMSYHISYICGDWSNVVWKPFMVASLWRIKIEILPLTYRGIARIIVGHIYVANYNIHACIHTKSFNILHIWGFHSCGCTQSTSRRTSPTLRRYLLGLDGKNGKHIQLRLLSTCLKASILVEHMMIKMFWNLRSVSEVWLWIQKDVAIFQVQLSVSLECMWFTNKAMCYHQKYLSKCIITTEKSRKPNHCIYICVFSRWQELQYVELFAGVANVWRCVSHSYAAAPGGYRLQQAG